MQLTDLGDRRGELYSGVNIETDGQYLYFPWGVVEGDIWVADFVSSNRSGD